MKGKFKPRAKRKQSTALARRKTEPMARRRRRSRSRGRARRSGGGGGQSFKSQAQNLMMGGAIYGFITEGAGASTAAVTTNLAKIPTIGNRDITNGLALYFLDKHLTKSKYVKAAAMAALVSGAVKFGQAGFSLNGEGLEGDFDDAIDVSGVVGAGDFVE